MKLPAMLLSSALLLGSWAAAQTDPFLRAAPAQVKPTVRGNAAAAPASATPSFATPSAATQPLVAQAKETTFGSPRISGTAEATKLVFDLPKGMTYTLVPTFGGLRIDVGGVRVAPASSLRLAENLTEYRANNGQIIIGHALSPVAERRLAGDRSDHRERQPGADRRTRLATARRRRQRGRAGACRGARRPACPGELAGPGARDRHGGEQRPHQPPPPATASSSSPPPRRRPWPRCPAPTPPAPARWWAAFPAR
ncbi:hypothetical protein ACXXDK_13875 [Deinococcus sp. PESE-38]